MLGELPADVSSSLSELLDRGTNAARSRDDRTLESVLDSVETLAHHDVADDEARETLLHGCQRARATMSSEPLVAAEYLESMARLVDE